MRRISAQPPTLIEYLKKVFLYRYLIVLFAKRDLKSKYAQTLLGLGWTFIQPLTGVIIFTVLFGGFIELDTGKIPYLFFAFSGVINWYLFVYIFNSASSSIYQSQEIIKKIYFPKLILPLSKILIALFEFLLSFLLLIIVMLIWGKKISINVVFAPFFVFILVLSASTLSLLLISLSYRYRDLHHLVPYITNYAIWLTPVFYPVTIIPEKYHSVLYFINPIALAIDGFRWSIFDSAFPSPVYFFSLIWLIVLFVLSIFLFIRNERKLIDTL